MRAWAVSRLGAAQQLRDHPDAAAAAQPTCSRRRRRRIGAGADALQQRPRCRRQDAQDVRQYHEQKHRPRRRHHRPCRRRGGDRKQEGKLNAGVRKSSESLVWSFKFEMGELVYIGFVVGRSVGTVRPRSHARFEVSRACSWPRTRAARGVCARLVLNRGSR